MKNRAIWTRLLSCVSVAALILLPVTESRASESDTRPAKPTVPTSEYGRWETLTNASLSPAGDGVAWEVERVDGDRTLQVRRLDLVKATEGDTGSDGSWEIPWGTDAEFAKRGRFVVWRVTPSKSEQEALQKDNKPIRDRGEVLDLVSGERRDLGEVAALDFDAAGGYLALLGYVAETVPAGEDAPADLHVYDLTAGTKVVFGDVDQYAWHEERPLLAFSVRGDGGRGNALQVWAPAAGRLVALDHAASTYHHLTWHEAADDLAVLRSPADAEEKDPKDEEAVDTTEYDVLVWRGIASAEVASPSQVQRLDAGTLGRDVEVLFDGEATIYAPAAEALTSTYYVSADRALAWSPDGTRLSLGLRERPAGEEDSEPEASDDAAEVEGTDGESEGQEAETGAEDEEGDIEPAGDKQKEDDPTAGVQIWHSSDVRIVPRQRAQAQRDRERTLLAVWDLDADRVVRVSSALEHEAEVLESWTHGAETDETPYPWGNMFGRPYRDVWTVDLASGERRLSLQKRRYTWPSTGGRYLLFFDGEHYSTLELATGVERRITQDVKRADGTPVQFADLDRDLPNDGLQPPFGVGGWMTDDQAVLLYDEFDVWRVAPDGSSAERITAPAAGATGTGGTHRGGVEDTIVHRLLDLDEEEEAFDPDELFFRLRHEWTEQRGVARWTSQEGYERLRLEDYNLRDLQRSETLDKVAGTFMGTYLLHRESRTVPPHLLLTNTDLETVEVFAKTNAFLDDYAWMRTELVEYRNAEDRRLQGVLLYPAQYESGKVYPMIVYGYEILSPSLHSWEPPSEKDVYNYTAWTQRGYFVLLPDVHFRGGDPGVSLAETLEAAIGVVAERGLVDRAKVGFVGHSWGGYSSAYLAARTQLFAATVAGAPLTDFVSFMGQIHTGPGIPEVDHWETGQARMRVPYWEDPASHERNSPLHGVHEMTTPILMMHGDSDSVVEFFQSSVFYNFARRAGKQMVLLVYEGEDHGLRRDENRIDYHRRILEWFGHYLRGEPAPAWITEGVTWLEHKDETRRVAAQPD